MKKEYILGIIIILLLVFFWYKKRKTTETSTDQTETTTKIIPDPGETNKVNISRIITVLQKYDNYCKIKGWKNNFIINDEVAKNIYVHYYIETGGGKYLYDNNTHNITQGSWTSQDKMYLASPYIRDVYSHPYLGVRERKDIGTGNPSQTQKFRMYYAIEDGLMDYIDLINRAKRYSGIPKLYQHKDPVFIRELKNAGYYEAKDLYDTAKNLKKQWGWL